MKKAQINTIRQELHDYLHQIFLVVLFTLILTISFCILSAIHNQQETRRIYLVNDFYTGLWDEHRLLYDYTLEQQEDLLIQMNNNLAVLDKTLSEMLLLEVNTSFRRDILDLMGMMENYSRQTRLLFGLTQDGADRMEINQTYYDANNTYLVMYDTFHTLYSQLLAKSKETSQVYRRNFFFFILMMFLTVILLLRYLSLKMANTEEKISRPIQQLAKDVQNMDLLHLDNAHCLPQAPSDNTNEEVILLIQTYNSMLEKIRQQFLEQEEYHNTKLRLQEQENLRLQISNELKKSQLQNLQMQINPHFLFNTLSMISHSAYLADDYETVELLDITSDLLRYILDYSDKAVTLEKEIEQLGNYIYLQEKRFGDRIRFIFDLDEKYHQVLVPNMILQPLVENAIIHGTGMYTHGGCIRICTCGIPSQEKIKIQIIDNGRGASAEETARVQQKLQSNQIASGKIGLANIAFRLNLFFNGQSSIQFTSIPGKHTEVCIEIPCQTKEAALCTE